MSNKEMKRIGDYIREVDVRNQEIVSEYETVTAASASMNKSSPSWKKRRKSSIARCLWIGLTRRICRKDGEWERWGR